MTYLISELRGMGAVGTADFSVAGVNKFSDDELQDILDRRRAEVYEPLSYRSRYDGGTAIVTEFYYAPRWVERLDSGTAAWQVEATQGSAISTANYSVEYNARKLTFTSNQLGTAYYLRARSYDLNRAAADVWRLKAAYYAAQFDISTDNHSLKRSQLVTQCQRMIDFYDQQAGGGYIRMERVDSNW
jgi:hypothetical protein